MRKISRRSRSAPRHARPQSHCPARPIVLTGVAVVGVTVPLTGILPAQASVKRAPDNHVILTRAATPALTPAQLRYHHWRHEKHLEHMARLAALAWAARHPAVVTVSHSSSGGDGDRDGDDGTGTVVTAAVTSGGGTSSGTYQGSTAMQRCIIGRESGGNAYIWNATGHWGLYQFSYATWVAHGGAPALFGHAGPAYQTQIFWATVAVDGYSDWAPYDGC
jgi:hypothetical protein